MILLLGFFETIKGAAITVPKNTLIICKIVKEFNSAPKKNKPLSDFFFKSKYFFFALMRLDLIGIDMQKLA